MKEDTEGKGEETAGSSGRLKSEIIKILRDASLAIFICLFVIYFLFQPFKVEGNSMSPSLRDDERIIVNKFCYAFQKIERGDMIVFCLKGDRSKTYVKRIVGVPGDEIEIRYGFVILNGKQLEESYIEGLLDEREHQGPVYVGPGSYYVLGDSRDNSNDSRNWGLVRKENIVGKVVLRYWPLQKFEML